MLDTPVNLASSPREDEDLSLAQDLRLLASEARTFAQAELAYQKSRAAYAGAEARAIAMLGLLAAGLVFFALMGLVLGAVIAVGTLVGPWLAMLLVPLVVIVIAAMCGLSARNRMRRMKTLLSEKGAAE
ncbi:phage holin family protein [Novosphingobium sp. ST904]|uniref:phage holin family protein n=1 Tax=Novosphingobium sp. ST904 TaxID=1684385 RepID=UPI0006C85036|nr:phage holin family protein [Novosphingobium sp. ST904]KPH66553.1 hypothetical protein ADT71_05465 [Novosphingobium sp. ST904]TCM42332.1 putative superfamily III holin-X [Novosphingobium sp. ST904]